MMPGSEERWRDGSGTTAGALGHLLERMTNDFTPQHDSQHYQPGFVPSATPPWTTSSQTPLTSLGSPMPPLQTSHTSLGSQIPPLQSNHTSLGSQVPSMQSAHSNMGPQMSPLQPPTTSAPGGLPPGPQLTGSASRSYSVSQDLFSELDGGRSPLLRSSSDLGLRLSHYHAQGSPYNDGRLDGFMDSSMDSLDGMLVGSPDSAFFLEVQRGPAVSSGTPPLQGDPQGLTSSAVPHPEFSFYSHENDRRMEGESVSNFSAKFSNFTASLGSWFSPLDPFRSNLTAAQAKTPCVTQPSSVGTGLESSRTSTSIILGNGPSIFKTSANSPTHQPKKLSVRGDVKKNNSEKISNSLHCEGEEMKGSDQLNNKVTSTQQKQPPRKTSYINNILNATSSPTVPTASATSSGCSSANPQATANHTSTIPITNNATASSTLNFTVTNNNNDSERGDGNKIKSTQMPKEDKKTHDIVGNTSSGGRPGGRNKTTANGRGDRTDRNRENQSKRPVRKRKETPFINHSELVAQGWAVAVHWVGLVVQAVVWLGTLAADVVVMSSRLFLHLMTVIWARFLEYWHTVKISVRHYWARLTSTFWKNDKEEKKIPGREKKIPRGLECNISLPTTGDEAMKRLLACKGKDPYSILGVTQECTDEDIKKYYKRQAFLVHPDKNKQPGAEEAFKILAHAFEIIGEPERRREYDARLAEEVQLEGAWGELASLLTRLQEKLDEAANTIRCTNCNKRHRRGDIWAESTFLGLRWKYYACMEGAVYDISDWAACQSENLKHLQANTHSVQYRIVSGKKSPPSKNNTPEFPSDPDLEEFFNNLCKEKFGKNYASGSSQPGGQQMSDMRKRKNKKKK
ncbi:DnaJ subfamily C member 14-like [Homarus americanus]|uniref:DnaJ subfamily C member 14-like n=1 Tax=Homarus americanus TaxID=6706 RepID=A0A8J5NDU9_HOMAM|nr:DnaJ subfamily C member 14-like [Homarus americanus]